MRTEEEDEDLDEHKDYVETSSLVRGLRFDTSMISIMQNIPVQQLGKMRSSYYLSDMRRISLAMLPMKRVEPLPSIISAFTVSRWG